MATRMDAEPPAPAPVPVAAPVVTLQTPTQLPAPSRYAGDPKACRGFLNQCFVRFALLPGQFPTDSVKVAYIFSLLDGRALNWASPMWEKNDVILTNLDSFTASFRAAFDEPARQTSATSELLQLRQGARTLSEYALEFCTLALEVGWRDVALRGIFLEGLADRIKDELAARDIPEDLNTLIELAGRIDRRLQQRAKEAPISTCSESCGPGFRKAILEGQPACCFDCIPCSEDEFSNQTDATDCMKCPDDQWPTKRNDGCQEKSIEFLSYQEPLGMTLAVTSVLGALVPAVILTVFIWKHHTPLVKANNRELSYLLLLALSLCFGCSLVFIGHPTNLVCMVRQIAFGVVFAICISCLLAKTIIVTIAFKATKPNSNLRSWVGPQLPSTLVLACSLVQVLICVTWLIVAPPFSQMSMKSQMGKIIFECNEGSLIAFWCMLGYMGLLASISFIVAFLARKLPDSFNEATFITFSMLIFIAVWLSFIPAYLSTRGKYTVAVEIFAILSSSAGLLGCIFFPKCYIILIRPEINTKEFLMGKTTGNLKNAK
ncbi:vomeronasal type-2 receptor 26-like [Rhinatrema bivittatum]|uniref:vomeronasal type-2 receptor 26-like n=1 Tax=Rhinatrema bivittatum TaxID=194408 RepID=UPI00112C914E|nr:vomeronasal type-2 receptor 26-like [Rhinatrema bivittatum]